MAEEEAPGKVIAAGRLMAGSAAIQDTFSAGRSITQVVIAVILPSERRLTLMKSRSSLNPPQLQS